jgi:hypothetical protein
MEDYPVVILSGVRRESSPALFLDPSLKPAGMTRGYAPEDADSKNRENRVDPERYIL